MFWLIVQNVFKGQTEISLLKDRRLVSREILINGIETTWKKIGVLYLKALLIGLVLGVSIAGIANYFDL